MSMLADDLANIFADTSVTVSVVFGTECVRGHLTTEDVPEEDGHGGILIASRRTVTIATGALASLTTSSHGSSITVDGTTYTVHGVRAAGRGRTKIVLA